MDLAILQQLGVSLALGTLVGLERENKQGKSSATAYAGIRTFGLIALLGCLAYTISQFSPLLFPVITVGFLALMVAAYVFASQKFSQAGMTSEIAGVLVYLLGVLAAMELYVVAIAIALALLVFLHFKKPLHMWAKNVSGTELVSTIQFMIIAFIVLPLLPNEYYGPYDFFNPYLIWLMVVFISGISFSSYVAIKVFGQKRGIAFTGFLAGFISSTALAFSFSGQSLKNKKIVTPYVLAVIIASTAMFFRVLLEVAVLNPGLLRMALLPMVAMGLTGIIAGLYFWKQKERGTQKVKAEVKKNALALESPFQIKPALKFALFFSAILLVSKAAHDFVGKEGLYVTSVVSGLLDVDAITVSISSLANDGLEYGTAVKAITLAAITNTMAKAGIFLLFGSREAAHKILAVFLIISMVGGVSMLFI